MTLAIVAPVTNAPPVPSGKARASTSQPRTQDSKAGAKGDETSEKLFWSHAPAIQLAARAAGIVILDGVHLNLNDDGGFEYSCKQGAEMGFDGKTLIHPKTIDAANKAFSPPPEIIEWSKKIIIAHAEATAEGKGVVVVEGKLIENLHVEDAKRSVALAEAIEEMSAANAA